MLSIDLERFNEWWFTGKIRKELAPSFRRHAFGRILQSLGERQILVLTGLRRVGKTSDKSKRDLSHPPSTLCK